MKIQSIEMVTAGMLSIAAATSAAAFHPVRGVRIGSGLEAHSICSAVFVQRVDAGATHREMVKLLSGPFGNLLQFKVDRALPGVDASFAGMAHARADFTPGYGCRLRHRGDNAAPPPLTLSEPPLPDAFGPSDIVTTTDPALASAIDKVFKDVPGARLKNVKAVVIVKNGHVVAERYAPGFGVETPLLSWSVAKSFTNAFLAVLVREGKLKVGQPVGAPEWAKAGDPRGMLTVEDLLRMRSGLNVREDASSTSAVARMLFLTSDMAAFAANHPLKRRPGTVYEYTSANTMILDRLIGRTIGGGPEQMRAFAEHEIFEPLHMSNVTMEFDGAGTVGGASWIYAPARGFARFGELYLDDGIAPDGRRLLPAGWVAWSRESTLGAPYGAGFWTNDGPSEFAAHRVARGFPKDGFYASGNLGQRVYIVPSQRLVVVRFGYSPPPSFGISDDENLIKAAIEASRLRPPDVGIK